MLIIAALTTFGPKVEGYLFPVSKLHNAEFSQLAINETLIEGEFDKFRECDFLELNAFVINAAGVRVLVEIVLLRPVSVLGEGRFKWGPWALKMPIWRINELQLELVTYHRCHPFWITETLFYEGPAPSQVVLPKQM